LTALDQFAEIEMEAQWNLRESDGANVTVNSYEPAWM
jgi:hypothetical protein